MAVITKPKIFVCNEAFAAGLMDGDVWFKVGQRVASDNEVFKGESGRNRRERLFHLAEESE